MKKVLIVVMIMLGLLFFLGIFFPLAHGAIASKRHDNSFGAVISFDNPNQYLYGSIVDGTIIDRGNKLGTVIRFQPYHTMALFTTEVLFCGNEAQSFNGMTGPIVVTYEVVAHSTVDGIGCHNLVGVNKVVPNTHE